VKFRLIDSGWDSALSEAVSAGHPSIQIICPFIKERSARRLLKHGKPKLLRVITRFNLDDIAAGVNDISALRMFLEHGAEIRGVRNLHSKLYLFGDNHAIVTSANLTEAALLTNHELGFEATDAAIVDPCRQYFKRLWDRAGKNLEPARLVDWESKIEKRRAAAPPSGITTVLGDLGIDLGFPSAAVAIPPWLGRVNQSFVKFFGESHKREDRSKKILDELRGSGSHWACTYPKGKRPRNVKDGAIMFMARLVKDPNDILIYGRAVAFHREGSGDDATAEDIRARPWKAKWPHYVLVDSPEFVAGSLADGVSLYELMDSLKADSFMPTQRHSRKGAGNTNPRKSLMQQPAVQLSPQGAAWLNARLESAFEKSGRITPNELEQLDWPSTPH
jgi:HKD family nuclease